MKTWVVYILAIVVVISIAGDFTVASGILNNQSSLSYEGTVTPVQDAALSAEEGNTQEAAAQSIEETAASEDTYEATESSQVIYEETETTKETREEEENISDMYAAYRDILHSNETEIREYNWQGDGGEYDNAEADAIAFSDVAGDGNPELIYISCNSEMGHTTNLHIVSWRNQEAVEIYNDYWDYKAASCLTYALYHRSDGKKLYSYQSEGDEYQACRICVYEEDSSGYLTENILLECRYYYSPSDGEGWYKQDGEEVSFDTYEAAFMELISDGDIFMKGLKSENAQLGDVEDLANSSASAMNYDEAMEYLEEKINDNAAQTRTETAADNSETSAAYTLYKGSATQIETVLDEEDISGESVTSWSDFVLKYPDVACGDAEKMHVYICRLMENNVQTDQLTFLNLDRPGKVFSSRANNHEIVDVYDVDEYYIRYQGELVCGRAEITVMDYS